MKLTYCPECAEPLTKHDDTHYVCPNQHDFYNNPSTAAGVVLVNDKGELLFAKRARAPQQGKYDLPGGFVEYGENAPEAARRELLEEAGITLGELELITCVSNYYQENTTTVDIIFLCREWSGELQAQDDVAALEWKPLEFLASPAIAWSHYPEIIKPLTKALERTHD